MALYLLRREVETYRTLRLAEFHGQRKSDVSEAHDSDGGHYLDCPSDQQRFTDASTPSPDRGRILRPFARLQRLRQPCDLRLAGELVTELGEGVEFLLG